jgi:hypothetical protein
MYTRQHVLFEPKFNNRALMHLVVAAAAGTVLLVCCRLDRCAILLHRFNTWPDLSATSILHNLLTAATKHRISAFASLQQQDACSLSTLLLAQAQDSTTS